MTDSGYCGTTLGGSIAAVERTEVDTSNVDRESSVSGRRMVEDPPSEECRTGRVVKGQLPDIETLSKGYNLLVTGTVVFVNILCHPLFDWKKPDFRSS